MIELTEDYLPEKFLFRENQIESIKKVFDQFKKYKVGSNLLILGTTGAGKTGILKKIIDEENNNVYISVAEYRTTHKILKRLSNKNIHSNSELLNCVIENFKKSKEILILDEVGKIMDMELFCDFLNSLYRNTGVPIILATNKWTFVEEMPDDARLTLIFKRIELPCYDSNQLYKICKQRLDLVKDNPLEISEESLRFLCAKIVKEQFSSVRVALSILLECIKNHNQSIKFIDEQIEYIAEQDWRNFVHKLTATEREFLNVVLDITESSLEISMPEISSRLSKMVGPSRVSQLATTFIDYGIFKTKWKHLGRAGGKHRIISFSRPDYRVKLLKLLTPWE